MTINLFNLHPQLANDCFEIIDLPLSKVLLFNNVNFPWLILVPRIADITEIFELPTEQQHQLIEEISKASFILEDMYACDKINIAAIGNQVPQLHIHIVARFKTDSAWPKVVWGLPTHPYQNEAAEKLIAMIRTKLAIIFKN